MFIIVPTLVYHEDGSATESRLIVNSDVISFVTPYKSVEPNGPCFIEYKDTEIEPTIIALSVHQLILMLNV